MRVYPASVGLIPDGTRRWAERRGVGLVEAYTRSLLVLRRIVKYLLDVGVSYLYVYGLSMENCARRPQESLEALDVAVRRLAPRLIEELEARGVHVAFIGDPGRAPRGVAQIAMGRLLRPGEVPEPPVVIVAVCYSALVEPGCLGYTRSLPKIDLVYRSGGYRRLSGFFPILSDYAELYFDDALWPEVDVERVRRALEWYSGVKRNFGR